MKIDIKTLIFGIVIGIIISGITVYAVNISSNNVEYDNTNSGLSSTNVEGAINELYEDASKKMALNTFGETLYGQTLSSYLKGDTVTPISINKGKYIIVSLKSYSDVESKKSADRSEDYDYSSELQCESNECIIQMVSSKFYKRSADSKFSNAYLSSLNWLTVYYVQIFSDNDTIKFIGNWPKDYPIVPITYAIQAIPINE